MTFGTGFTTGYSCRIEMYGEVVKDKLIIGENCIIGDYAHITANKKVTIGNNVLMASRVFITDTGHGNYSNFSEKSAPLIPPNERPLYCNEVLIGDNVWIGENVSILPGVTIGNGCVIGANSVVTKNIPLNSIAVGNPARVVKQYDIVTKKWC
ncbi:DapH/DapD/GlmU-related protein [Paenibacillus phytohabitans]|uniref:DapH/DapD/GlmU-related protein n=1 Tax=Paenibacillus phytohabitans TaxID=2654978 RepID=UPI003AB23EC7